MPGRMSNYHCTSKYSDDYNTVTPNEVTIAKVSQPIVPWAGWSTKLPAQENMIVKIWMRGQKDFWDTFVGMVGDFYWRHDNRVPRKYHIMMFQIMGI